MAGRRTRCSARCTRSRAAATGASGTNRCAIATPQALDAARARLAPAVRYYQYLQWIADDQWRRAREACGPVGVFGDFPFMVNGHSADVWARQHEFHLDASVGVPPEPGATEGQDWGLPAYRWEVVAPDGYVWLGERARRSAELFDAFRVDHLVGFYRTFIRPRHGAGFFSPREEPSQTAQGEALMALFRRHGCGIIAEDLGDRAGLRARVAGQAGGAGAQGAALGA